jgi:hypothetical protein
MPTGRAVGDAGTVLGIARALPHAVPTESDLPGAGEQLPKQSMLEGGFGIATAQVNSESYLTYERAIAQASPGGVALRGHAPQSPGAIAQTALPDNPRPTSAGFASPGNPLLTVHGLDGRVHARWSRTQGPCVDGHIADAATSADSLSLVNNVPALPAPGRLARAGDALRQALDSLPGPLSRLGGLLSGGDRPKDDGSGSLLSTPNTLATRSVVRLTGLPGTERKAVESTSTLRSGDLRVLDGSPLGFTLKVVSQPTLRVTSTGNPDTSTVDYTAPVLAAERDGKTLFQLDAAHPTEDIPIGIPLPGLRTVPGFAGVADVPVVGGAATLSDGGIKRLTDQARRHVLDLAVLRLTTAGLDKNGMRLQQPFPGYQLGATAHLLDVRLLPTQALKDALPTDMAEQLPSALAHVSLGEQVARGYAPTGGVACGSTTPPSSGGGQHRAGGAAGGTGTPLRLAQTSAAYSTVPLFWTGTGMLLLGVILVVGFPRRGRADGSTPVSAPVPAPQPPED